MASTTRRHHKSRRRAPARTPRVTTTPGIRIVVADSQALDRKGMMGLLREQDDFEVAGEAGNIDDAIRLCGEVKPDVLILALNISGPDGDPPIPAIRAVLPSLRILAMSERGDHNCLVLNPPGRRRIQAERNLLSCGTDCLQLAAVQGAVGTMRRSAEPAELFRAVRAIAQGNAWYEPGTASSFLIATNGNGKAPAMTDRELDVASLIAEGKSNKEIAAELDISEPTVKKHVGRILEKLGLEDRLQAGLFVARNPLTLRRI